jgi:hypothetical protein
MVGDAHRLTFDALRAQGSSTWSASSCELERAGDGFRVQTRAKARKGVFSMGYA